MPLPIGDRNEGCSSIELVITWLTVRIKTLATAREVRLRGDGGHHRRWYIPYLILEG